MTVLEVEDSGSKGIVSSGLPVSLAIGNDEAERVAVGVEGAAVAVENLF